MWQMKSSVIFYFLIKNIWYIIIIVLKGSVSMIEIIGTCLDDAIKIEKSGGDRIELISALTEGGLTPSYGLIKKVLENVNIPVNIMIRPHAKSFTYSNKDIETMIEDMKMVKKLGANGIVLGIMDTNGNVDEEKLKLLLKHTGELEVTFHKAIDESVDIVKSISILKNYPQINRILTSGGKGKIEDNLEIINNMIRESENQIIIMLGGGLTFDNVENILSSTKVSEVHFGTAVRVDSSPFGDIDEEKLKYMGELVRTSLNKFSTNEKTC